MGAVALDADVLIGFLNRDDAHHAAARKVVADAASSGEPMVIAASVYAEAIVGPLRAGRAHEVDEMIAALAIDVVPIDALIARQAAELRARHRTLRLPDAMSLAAAQASGARLRTFDRRLARIAAAS